MLIVLLLLPGRGYAGDPAAEKEHIRALIAEAPSYRRDSLLITAFRAFWVEIEGEEEFIDHCLKEIARDAPVSKWAPAMANYYYLQGSEYLRKNQLYAAFDYLERSIREFKELKDEKNFVRVNNKFIPLMNWNMIENEIPEGSKEKYAGYISEALKAAESGGDTAVIANLKITQASYMLFVLKDYRKSLQLVDEILDLLKDKDKEEWFSYYHITLLGQSLNYLNLGETERGEKILHAIIKSCQERPDFNQARYILGQVSGFVGRYYLNKKDYKNALKYASLAEGKTDFMRFPYFANYLNETLYGVYKHNGKADSALKYLEKVWWYEQEAKAERLNQGFAEWQIKYETEKHKSQITQLENESLLKSKQQDRILLTVLLAMVITGVIATVFIMNSNRKLKQKNEELELKNEEITKAVFKGQTIERKRMASELHDNLNTKIAALKWRFETTENPTREQLSAFVQILDDIYVDVRLISHNLIPVDLETAGLVISIQKLIKNLDKHPTVFHFLDKEFTGRLPVDLEYQVYNIVLELINNILKHSGATQAWISLSRADDQVTLTVSDNGIGLPSGTAGKGVGLTNIKSRVEQLKGRISFPAASEKGTTIRISFPLI